MAQNIKELLKESEMTTNKLPNGHKNRFENRLDSEFLKQKKQFPLLKIAASFLVLLSLGFAGYQFLNSDKIPQEIVQTEDSEDKINSMADISPDLKKIEDFYLTRINYQIARIKITDENKDLLEVYLSQLADLQQEYDNLNTKLNADEITEETIDALIENLQLRLQLLRQLKKKLKIIENLKKQQNEQV